ncbi:MAG: TonB-dependent receptor [Bacteroidia bacterium]|nr:TonB-dependent receptor [Bacteroidia bacterium]
MKQKHWLWFFCLMFAIGAGAQTRSGLSGRIVDAFTGEPISGVRIILRVNNQITNTDQNGAFTFSALQPENETMGIHGADFSREIPVQLTPNETIDLGNIEIERRQPVDQQFVGIIDESMLTMETEGEGLSQDVSTMVIFSNDVFLRSAGYQFSQFRYRLRGYESQFEDRYINGVNFNEQIRGVFNYSSIGALNDITRNGDAINYFAPSTFSFGSIGGSENINMRPGSFTRGGKLTASLTNRNYYSRGMFSYSTGMQDNGWAVTAAVGARYSHEGFIEGVFYKNISYAVGVEKEWDGGAHSLSFITFGSPVERGQQGSSYQETYDLTNNNLYNPNWGYQNGKKRNARVVKSYDPTGILSHVWRINEQSRLTTGLGVHYNRYGRSALNWYNGPDPRPDYYRYMPSYHKEDQTTFDYYTYLWTVCDRDQNISQINWDKLWEVNHLNNEHGNGSAIYMVEERRSDLLETTFNSTFNTKLSNQVNLNAGVGYKYSLSKQFKTVDDLLGAKYLMDVDKFAERDFPGNTVAVQNDLNRPDRKVYEGDIFGYDYRYRVNSADIWFQQEHTYRYIDFYFGGKLKHTQMQRVGNMKNGRYPDNSYGDGQKLHFTNYETKAGITYKLNGRHFFTGNVSYQTKAPLVERIYISPAITDQSIETPKSLEIFSADISYVFSTPKISGRVSLYQTNFMNDIKRISYYHDAERTFVNHVLSGLNRTHRGIEAGVNYKLNNNWNFNLIGSVAEYFYTNNPEGVMNSENGKIQDMKETVYMKNYYMGGMPQSIGTFGINFFHSYWFLNLNINAFGRNYVEIAPIRRLASNYKEVMPPAASGFDQKLYDAYLSLIDQERFDGGVTVDFSIGKIWYLRNRNSVNFNFSINNILNNRNVRTGGYEQGRINLEYPDRFASKYYYMQGINAFFNISYRFQ